mgnify:CR=1 FL=1
MAAHTPFHSSSSSLDLALVESNSFYEDIKTPAWSAAMNEEYQALQKQKTWILVPLLSDKQAIGCKWVFRLKKNSDGSSTHHKACLVAKGYLQKEGIS